MGYRANAGYTILEVLIFLAISGVMFASAVVAVGGNQARVQYSQAVRDFEIQIKDIMNDVSNGYYPNYGDSRCRTTGNGNGRRVAFDASAADQGANIDCINIGKNLMFNLDTERIGVGTIVGINPGLGQSPDISFASTKPKLAYQSNIIDLTEYKPIRFGARVTKIGANNRAETFSSLIFSTGYSTSAGSTTRTEGTLAVNVAGIVGSLTDARTLDEYASDIEDLAAATGASLVTNPVEGFYICLQTTDNKRARLIIGSDGVVTATKTEFDLTAGEVCP